MVIDAREPRALDVLLVGFGARADALAAACAEAGVPVQCRVAVDEAAALFEPAAGGADLLAIDAARAARIGAAALASLCRAEPRAALLKLPPEAAPAAAQLRAMLKRLAAEPGRRR